jgi:hypothetical protein
MSQLDPLPAVHVAAVRTAEMLIQRHGDAAKGFAQAQADRLIKDGSEAGAVEWRRVVAAICEIQTEKRKS